MERKEYQLSEVDRQMLIKASQPVPYLIVGGVQPLNPQENANRAWQSLGEKYHFDWETVERVEGKSDYYFTAIPTEEPNGPEAA